MTSELVVCNNNLFIFNEMQIQINSETEIYRLQFENAPANHDLQYVWTPLTTPFLPSLTHCGL